MVHNDDNENKESRRRSFKSFKSRKTGYSRDKIGREINSYLECLGDIFSDDLITNFYLMS